MGIACFHQMKATPIYSRARARKKTNSPIIWRREGVDILDKNVKEVEE